MRLRHNPKANEELLASNLIPQRIPFTLPKNSIIELGMGKGDMLSQMALLNPQTHFLGIEKFATVAAKAAKKIRDLELKNLNIICEDIINLPNILKGRAQTIWLTFSDPWPKARHAKRRLTSPKFLEIYQHFLDENGILKIKTDNDNFFAYSQAMLKENNWTIINQTTNLQESKFSTTNVLTEYEKKWLNTGKSINYLEAKFNLKNNHL